MRSFRPLDKGRGGGLVYQANFSTSVWSKNKRGALPCIRHCRITVYRNPPTQTDQYPAHKRFVCFVFRTLIHLAENLVTNDKDEKEEIEHVKSALRANDYLIFQISQKS